MPAIAFAARVGDVALPDESVVTAAELAEPANRATEPTVGARKLTVAPGTVLPNTSFTCATSGAANVVLTTVDCGVPWTIEMATGVSGLLVSV